MSSDDEAFARRLQAEEDAKHAATEHDAEVAGAMDPWNQAADEWDKVDQVRNSEASERFVEKQQREESFQQSRKSRQEQEDAKLARQMSKK